MERLLNIKEAAETLNVSEMTVRRWTNAGWLHCYRVGGKRERRFTIRDLQDYLEKENGRTDKGGDMRLGCGGFTVPDGSHITHLSLDTPEALEVGSSYVLEGLKKGETVLLVALVEKTESILRMLQERGADPESFRKNGKLHLSEGMDTPASQAEHIAQIVAASRGRFRVFGDMSWAKQKGWSLESLRELEEMAGAAAGSPETLLLCQYPLENFSGMAAMMAVETHDYALYKGVLMERPWARP
jgi:transcriptional repressor of dcmA and dcmR